MKKSYHNSINPEGIGKRILFLMLLAVAGCVEPVDYRTQYDEKHDGYVPVYGTEADRDISFQASRQVKDPGRIYIYDKYLLINENSQGIHIYNNEDPANPQPVGFIRILGSFDMAVKDNVLYAGHFGSITAIDLNSFEDLQVKETLTLDDWNYGVAPPAGSYFECVNAEKGPVVGWVKVDSKLFDCYAIR
jgi:hypothetical protein